jgi:hypothetical protein
MDSMNILVAAVLGVIVVFGLFGLSMLNNRYKEKGAIGGLEIKQGPMTRKIGMVQAIMGMGGLALIVAAALTQYMTLGYIGVALLFLALIARFARFATWISGE